MKTFILMAMVASLLIGGCCTSPNNSRKTVGNCVAKVLSPVKNILCPPNQQQISQALAAANFMASFFGKDYSVHLAMAEQIFLNVANGVCVALDQLQYALGQFDALAEIEQGQAMLQGKAVPKVPDVSALRAALRR